MVEDHTFWLILHHRFFEAGVHHVMPLKPMHRLIVKCVISQRWKKALYYQGTGRHSVEEMHKMARTDLQTASLILGDKQYFGGDEPCESDCSIFGMLVQIVYNAQGSDYEKMITVDFRNLYDYCLRMKQKCWPDWDKFLNVPKN